MKFTKTTIIAISILFIMSVAGMGCKSDNIKRIATVAAVAIAAKLLYDMYIDYKTEQTREDKQVVDKYKSQYNSLPDEPVLVSYESSIKPGEVVSAGNKISIQSSLEVVRGKAKETLEIKEQIIIYDNEDPTKELKSLVKVVNKESQRCGAFNNEFTFTLPKGMPQGVYPIKTKVIVDGKAFAPVDSRMQLVINTNQEQPLEHAQYRLAKAH
ncbi:hypothetical protein [Aliikangiella sp. G2MR2-5]|uniref:hypothetical protein n=1 Tax=Aliikangiella sp. G2MR2-5 TaxID=2788943 RepID=UPI0018AA6D32|nr:hypothetical protein [Aliikangiella sp. G2MR2-5]